MEFFLDAFFELDTERYAGMALGPIPASQIRAYAERYEYPEEDFVYFIRAMDQAYMKHQKKKEIRNGGKLSNVPSPSPSQGRYLQGEHTKVVEKYGDRSP